MKPPFSYYGGKVGMARHIVAVMPEHRVYIEPFFGSGAVLFSKPPSPHEIVNDINDVLVTFWRVLRERPEDLAAVCDMSPHARTEYETCAELRLDATGERLPDLEVARRWWVRITQGFAKTASPTTGWSITTATGRSIPATNQNRITRFDAAARRLAAVTIENCDAVGLLERFAIDDTVTVYADPPYLGETRVLRSQRTAGDYMHDMCDEESHRRLADALNTTPARVVLSGYPSPLYDALYADWRRIDLEVTAHSSNSARAGTRRSRTECLWTNFDPPAQTSLADHVGWSV